MTLPADILRMTSKTHVIFWLQAQKITHIQKRAGLWEWAHYHKQVLFPSDIEELRRPE
jgi:hypothetical protein